MKIWCDKCEDLTESEETIKTNYGQFCLKCYKIESLETESDFNELSATDLLLFQMEDK